MLFRHTRNFKYENSIGLMFINFINNLEIASLNPNKSKIETSHNLVL